MEKKTIDTLRVMLCGEIEDIAKQGTLSHETLDILKDLVETEKNLGKIERYDEEKKEKEEMKMMGGMNMDNGYSQRKYYIDADYDPRANSYAQGGNSYARGGNSYARGGQGGNSYYGPMYPMYDIGGSYMDGNSYNMNYGQGYGMPMYGRGYARTSSKEEMAMELKELLNEAKDEATRKAISEAIAKLEK